MKKMIQIVDGPPLRTNCFLLIGDEGHAVAIDPAAPAEEFVKALEENGATLTTILLTHGHHDHIGSVEALYEKYGAKVYMNEADARHFHMHPDDFYTDFGTIQVDDMVFTTIFTPGHTPGSTCIRCGDMLFSGDTLFADSIGRTDFEGGSMKQMKESLKKLADYTDEDLTVYPGHEESTTLAHEKAHNRYMQF